MTLESDLFRKKWPRFDQLEPYGFRKTGDAYIFIQILPTDQMRAEIHIDQKGNVSGKVIDPFSGDEYVSVHTSTPKGSYAARIRSEYLQVLEEIASACFTDVPFVSVQMNRISADIEQTYGVKLAHPFKRDKESGVYCHPASRRWFALIQEIEYSRLDEGRNGTGEILTLKKGSHYQKEAGIYPAWHMNHDQWISILMDDSVSDLLILKLIGDSYQATKPKTSADRREGHWIIPANPEYFDVDHAFRQSDSIYWKQSTHIRKGDLVFMYYGAPYSELRWLCQTIETDIPCHDPYEGPVKIEKMMRIKKLYFFENNRLNRKLLAQYGVRYVRGPLHIPIRLEEEIMRLYPKTAAIIRKKEGDKDE